MKSMRLTDRRARRKQAETKVSPGNSTSVSLRVREERGPYQLLSGGSGAVASLNSGLDHLHVPHLWGRTSRQLLRAGLGPGRKSGGDVPGIPHQPAPQHSLTAQGLAPSPKLQGLLQTVTWRPLGCGLRSEFSRVSEFPVAAVVSQLHWNCPGLRTLGPS